jgi:ketosteroid isomerase-like protein
MKRMVVVWQRATLINGSSPGLQIAGRGLVFQGFPDRNPVPVGGTFGYTFHPTNQAFTVNRRTFALTSCVALTFLVACGRGDTFAPSAVSDLAEEIRQADQSLLRAEGQRDLEATMTLVAPTAVFQPPGFPPISGRDAIRRFYEEQWFTLPFTEISGIADTIVVAASRDLAYIDGRSRLVLDVSGDRIVAEGKYLGVWQKTEGEWLLVAISWTANE